MEEQNKTNDEQMSKQTQSTSDSNTGSSSVDYDKIADILDKRGTQAQYTALKGYLKEQGVLVMNGFNICNFGSFWYKHFSPYNIKLSLLYKWEVFLLI